MVNIIGQNLKHKNGENFFGSESNRRTTRNAK